MYKEKYIMCEYKFKKSVKRTSKDLVMKSEYRVDKICALISRPRQQEVAIYRSHEGQIHTNIFLTNTIIHVAPTFSFIH